MATIKPELKAILDQYGINPKDSSQLWDCHGTLVLYHKAYEIIAAKENIVFDAPVVIEGNTKDKTVALLVTGRRGDRSEWSFGEASASNLKSTYPYAMAEKRAKDRVIAKLVGLAAYVYSEDEADDFKHGDKKAPEQPKEEPAYNAEKSRSNEFVTLAYQCKDQVELDSFIDEHQSEIDKLPDIYQDTVTQAIHFASEQIKTGKFAAVLTHQFAGVQDAIAWMKRMKPVVDGFRSTKLLTEWQTNNQPFINGLSVLKAEKYLADGKLPKERFTDALKAKYDELSNTELSQQPLAAE